METSDPSTASEDLYAQLDKYPWDDDPEFQGGLMAILGSTESPEQRSELTLRARCFYYSRKYEIPVDFDAYKAWRASNHTEASPIPAPTQPANGLSTGALDESSLLPRSSEPLTSGDPPSVVPSSASASSQIAQAQQTSSSEPQAPYPTSFQRIVELITTGQPIPGIKEIPNTVLEGQATESQKPQRRKPWERSGAEESQAVGGVEMGEGGR